MAHDPSRLARRLPVLLLSLVGCGIATYLTLYQVGVLNSVFEPFFGQGSRKIIRESGITKALHPVPDAGLGALAYLVEACTELLGGAGRWRKAPWKALATGLVGCALFVAAIVLVICQAAVYHAFCTMCLASAVCSVIIFALVVPELAATGRHVWRQVSRGRGWVSAVRGGGQTSG